MARTFRLTKWYLDLVGDHGEALIAYWAELRWRKLAVRYASVMTFAEGRLDERWTVRAGARPQLEEGRLTWSNAALRFEGEWVGGGAAPEKRELYRNASGAVAWQCLQPLTDTVVRCGERTIRGPGYTERVELELAPWELPIDELRWGRAHFAGRSVVWVDWTGAPPARLVLLDGQPVTAEHVSDDAVSGDGFKLQLASPQTIRKGEVAKSSVGEVPGIRSALSQAKLLMDEHKWVSRATLCAGDAVLEGPAIHERVKWR